MVIDRIEGDYAVAENGDTMIDILLSELPENVREGDMLVISHGKYIVNNKAADELKDELSARLDNLFKRKNYD